LTAIGEKAGTSAALAHKWRREKGRATSKPAFLGCLSLAGIDAVPSSSGWLLARMRGLDGGSQHLRLLKEKTSDYKRGLKQNF
jgi:hypothetical protein